MRQNYKPKASAKIILGQSKIKILNLILQIYLKPQIEQPTDCKILLHVVKLNMSSEQVTNKSTQAFILESENLELENNAQKKKNVKVDINLLMDKVREEKKKEKKETLIFVSLIASVILITGAIASF